MVRSFFFFLTLSSQFFILDTYLGLKTETTYIPTKLEGIMMVKEKRSVKRVAPEETDWGQTGPPQGHWDQISDLKILQTQEKLLLSSSRDGVIKVWK